MSLHISCGTRRLLRLRGAHVALGALFMLAAAGPVLAQTAANASVTATVAQPLAVNATAPLAFGTVVPGTNKTVAVSDASAAAFTISGNALGVVSLTFTLPGTLASGGNTMPVANWTGRRNTTNNAGAGTDFTPSSTPVQGSLSASGELYVFVGATAQPGASQAAGSYSGTITLTVVYF
jgi:hypothetical protein